MRMNEGQRWPLPGQLPGRGPAGRESASSSRAPRTPMAGPASTAAVAASVLLASVSACGPGGERVRFGAEAAPIIGGTIDDADPSVLALVYVQNSAVTTFCSGTLIAPHTLLSAGHCVTQNSGQAYVFLGNAFQDNGATVQIDDNFIPVVNGVAHPNFNERMSSTSIDDLSVFQIKSPPPGRKPIALYVSKLEVGASIRHVGFGSTTGQMIQDDGSGIKRQVTTMVRSISPVDPTLDGNGQIETGGINSGTCYGDSGGPGLMIPPGGTEEQVEGIVSWGDDSCLQSSWDTRVDSHVDWIMKTMSAWETVLPTPGGPSTEPGPGTSAGGGDPTPGPGSPVDPGTPATGSTPVDGTATYPPADSVGTSGGRSVPQAPTPVSSGGGNGDPGAGAAIAAGGSAQGPGGSVATSPSSSSATGGCSAVRGGAGLEPLALAAVALVVARRRRK